MPVRALWFERGALCLLDQRRLPGARIVRRLRRVEQVAEAIRGMTVRGAPSIGVSGAYGMALAARQGGIRSDQAARLLLATRPTAHDLSVGVGTVEEAWKRGEDPLAAADRYRETVVSECREIGRQGASLFRRRPRVLTHCNAGALATVEWGT
ncbi:MAG TPA: S-methyl-5-thioribose-1-phosphate isomerase, partial [Thermoplasmata archaeon]|nr:S-methyl-5-thioribose-1-phosphate isomerase [Thermoplasmata archaeon]